MAMFNDLKIPQLIKELQKRGLATKGVKSKLQSRLRRAMKSQIAEVSSQISEERDKIKTEMDELKDRLRELQLNRPIVSTASAKVKPPSFDGTVPFHVFKFQFEKTASSNNWNVKDKVAALFVALKGSAAEILQTIPNCEASSYETLMGALERRYGSEHSKQIFQIELRNRRQKANESLQEFCIEIERLAHLAYAHKSVDYIEDTKIQTGIRRSYGNDSTLPKVRS
nr:uncharacterized protein LOC118679930 [Bactrocera oleae]